MQEDVLLMHLFFFFGSKKQTSVHCDLAIARLYEGKSGSMITFVWKNVFLIFFSRRYNSYEEYQHEQLKREEYQRDYEKREGERAEQRERQRQKAIVSQHVNASFYLLLVFFFFLCFYSL